MGDDEMQIEVEIIDDGSTLPGEDSTMPSGAEFALAELLGEPMIDEDDPLLAAFTDAQLAKRLGTKRPVLRIVVLARGASPRVRMLRVVTRAGAVKDMRGSEVRRALGLRDTWFVVRRRVRTPATMRLVMAAP